MGKERHVEGRRRESSTKRPASCDDGRGSVEEKRCRDWRWEKYILM
jgi:hypothetical protein